MTKAARPTEDRRLRRKTAAFRLKHDVGKALRWSAPEERETDADALRTRLANDLVPRASPDAGTSGGSAERDVLQRFFEWKREEGPMFDAGDPDLATISRVLDRIAVERDELLSGAPPRPSAVTPPSSPSRKSPSSSLLFSRLSALDDACLEAARACTAFYRRVAVEEGPEILRRPASGVYPRRGGGSGA